MTFNDIMVPSSPLFHELEFLKLNDINNLQLVSFVYECINGLPLQYFENFFTSLSSEHSIVARQSKHSNLYLEQNTVQYGIRSIHYASAKPWNSVPYEIRLASSIKKNQIRNKGVFKGQLQRFHKLISNDRIWPSEHGFEVIFEKSLFVFEISAFKVRN